MEKRTFLNKWGSILKASPQQFITVMKAYTKVPDFLQKERIWEGFWAYGWVSKFLVFAAVLVGFSFVATLFSWIDNLTNHASNQALYATMTYSISDFGSRMYDFLFDGTAKYIILILMEVLIFHATRRTIEILFKRRLRKPVLKDFINAQIRMIKIVFLCWFMEILLSIPIELFFDIFGLQLLKPAGLMLLECYLLGFAIMDNYYEHFGLSIKESYQKMQEYLGVAIGIGLLLYLFLWIPILGAILGTMCAAVAAAFVLQELQPDLGREELVGEAYGTPPDLLPN